jgi:hypothetical protein
VIAGPFTQVTVEFSARARRPDPQTNGEPNHAYFVSWRTIIRVDIADSPQ